MPRLTIGDGYTLPGETKADTIEQTTGLPLYTGLPVVVFRYRPPVHEELLAYRYTWNRAQSGEEQAALDRKFVLSHITEWDVQTLDGGKAGINDENMKMIGEPIFSQIVNTCLTWGPKTQGQDEKN